MNIGVPKEIAEFEKRVAATPETVKKYIEAGASVSVQQGAGEACFIQDKDYEASGASIESDVSKLYANSDLILKVQRPHDEELKLFKENSYLISFIQPLVNADLVQQLADKKVNALSIDSVPRIARAQKLDALSSQANVAGYKAVLLAANSLGKMMPLMMTAAGTVSAAKVFVIGAGVAGLQAIATAKRLGAVVEGYDTRPVVRDQVESLGAKFVELEIEEDTETEGGYAKELSEEAKKQGQLLVEEHVINADIVITTAAIPGKKSPLLINKETVQKMKQGAVIVDLAAEGGGNCELTEAGKEVVKHGVTLIGHTNVPSLIPAQSSQLYARNVLSLFFEIYKAGNIEIDINDEIVKGALVSWNGEKV